MAIATLKRLFLLLPLIAVTSCATAGRELPSDQMADFARDVARSDHINAAQVTALLNQAHYRQDVIDAISRPAEALPWSRYRPIFLKPARIAEGVAFWNSHGELLDRINREYGVPPEIIVGILGVETRYGQHAGRYRVLDSLATLAFGYPPRSAFFKSELEQFILLSHEQGLDPLTLTGSYAGAMGMPQFIASSYRAYAVDGDGDGRSDLLNSTADAAASIANYFREHGWRAGDPVVVPAQSTQPGPVAHANEDMKPYMTVAQAAALGVKATVPLPDDTEVSLMELDGRDGKEYWLGLHNFYVITRYNHSPLYALAVTQLGQAIAREREENRR